MASRPRLCHRVTQQCVTIPKRTQFTSSRWGGHSQPWTGGQHPSSSVRMGVRPFVSLTGTGTRLWSLSSSRPAATCTVGTTAAEPSVAPWWRLVASTTLITKGWGRHSLTTAASSPALAVVGAGGIGARNLSNPSILPTFTKPHIFPTPDGRMMAAFDMRKHPKLKPHIVRRRLAKMKTYIGQEKAIRCSKWRLNLVCQFVAGLPLPEALLQLQFNHKGRAPLVHKVLTRTANLADIRDGIQPSQLEVAECFATRATPLKRIKFMGRGHTGRKERGHSHFRVVLREIDFKLRLYQAPNIRQKKKWLRLQHQAEVDYNAAKAKREEILRLEREAAANQSKKQTK